MCSATGHALGWETADLITIRTSVYPLIKLAQLPKTLGDSLLGLSVVARLVGLTPLPAAPPSMHLALPSGLYSNDTSYL